MFNLIGLVVLFFSVVLHEVAHGYVAYLYGDDTAKAAGRLSLNPLSHVDPMGTIFLPLFLMLSGSPVLFGWAKPVPINPYNMYDPRKGMMMTAISGPLTNYSIVILAALFFRIMAFPPFIQYVLVNFIIINLILGTFNLIPIPPLDGSRVVSYFLKGEWALRYQQLERYGILIIFLLLYLGVFDLVFNIIEPVLKFLIG